MLTTTNVTRFHLSSVATLHSGFKHTLPLRCIKMVRWDSSTFLKIVMGSLLGGWGDVKLNWNRLFHL